MKIRQVLLVIVIIVRLDLFYGQNNAGLHRVKKQAEKWVWEVSEHPANRNGKEATRPEEAATKQPEEPNPCNLPEPQMPNFSDGRRISEAKCFEYIWELNNRNDKIKRSSDCLEYQRKQANETRGPLTVNTVIGGYEAFPGQFPHMGALGWRGVRGNWFFKCGSSLISPKFLLTAAHCSKIASTDYTIANTRPEIVRLGDTIIFEMFRNGPDQIDLNILRVIVHPQYRPPRKYFDIAIIELVSDVSFHKYLQPACLWTDPDTSPLGTKASITGWGYVDMDRQRLTVDLQAASVDIIDTNLCNNLLRPTFNRHFNGVEPTQLCAGVLAGGVDTCQGDSGGPLQVKISLPIATEGSMSYVIGVTSFGFGCAHANRPGVYTRVSSFIDWIESIVWT